jgi:spermidine/putrescine transport system ATP-binding protein
MVGELVLCRAMTDTVMSGSAVTGGGASGGEAVVSLEKVTKAFGSMVAVDHLDLEIRRGEFFSMLGPSGCGKTTTLRMIGGFEEPDEGVVKLAGKDVTDVPAYKRDINTVFQSYGLFPHLNVFDNIAFGLRRRHVDGKEIQRRVGEALELVNLGKMGKRRPSQLSGGQQQRVALARALVNRPTVLLLDEPLGALDLKLRKQMQLELKRIQDEVGITFVFVTHDQEEAMTISDRIAVMNHGHIEQLGTPDVVYEQPASVFVAEFLGTSNLLEGTFTGVREGFGWVDLGDGNVIRIPADAKVRQGDRVHVGVRPEKISVYPPSTAADAGQNSLDATLLSSVFVGVSYQYYFETGNGRRLSAFDRNAGRGAVATAGDPMRLAWRPEHTFVIRVGAKDEQAIEDANEAGGGGESHE